MTDDEPHARVDYFGAFNLHGPSVMEYSQYEYDQHLVDPNWSADETRYLFDLLRQYDLRFVVAGDRYEYRGSRGKDPVKKRSIEVGGVAPMRSESNPTGNEGPVLHDLQETSADTNGLGPASAAAADCAVLF